ncbi:isatin hydrolase-like [Branchiostoma lanceolatum]|uniref:isatin hydrolase-like n=1 Tax=Branchiostoma lanceolatum TaxID=7740 RepID=UPI003455CC3C
MRGFHALTAWVICSCMHYSLGVLPGNPRIVDLTHTLVNGLVYWPGEVHYQWNMGFRGMTPGGFYLENNDFQSSEHSGTHVDAPAHMAEGKWKADQIQLERLTGPGVVVDLWEKNVTSDYLVSQQDFQDWEEKHGRIPDGCILMIHTGWAKRYWDGGQLAYMGSTNESGLSFPGLDPAAARWLADNRGMHAVGIDTCSVDSAKTEAKGSHTTLFALNIPFLENVANLDQLPATGSTIFALPIKIGGGSGAPARIIAIINGDTSAAASGPRQGLIGIGVLALVAILAFNVI